MKRMKLLFTLALPVILCQNLQAQTSSRLIAQAHWMNNGASFVPLDSTNYTYVSNARGGDLNHPMMFDNSNYWRWADTAYMDTVNTVQYFDVNNNDSVTIVSQNLGGTWTPYSATLNFYVSGMLQSSVYQSWTGGWSTQYRDNYSYVPGTSRVSADQYQQWNGVAYVTQSVRNYFYDGVTGLKIAETDDDLSTGTAIHTANYLYTYSSTGQLLTSTYQTYNSGTATWLNNSMVTNTYDTLGNNVTQEYQIWDAVNSLWANNTLAVYSNFLGSTHLAQTEILETWNPVGTGTWNYVTKYTNSYNSFNQLTHSVGISYNSSLPGWEFAYGDPMDNYYYNPYSIVNEVKNVSASNGTANIYPVPTQDIMHIDINWTVAQSATINIYDINGKSVKQIETGFGTHFNCGIPVSELSAGVYLVKINGQLGLIEKQIVVAH